MRRKSGRGDVGQHMLMLLGKEGEMMVNCWLCPVRFETRAAYLRHLAENHPGPCVRCGRVHSGKCDRSS